jgi:hypothetical protein
MSIFTKYSQIVCFTPPIVILCHDHDAAAVLAIIWETISRLTRRSMLDWSGDVIGRFLRTVQGYEARVIFCKQLQ